MDNKQNPLGTAPVGRLMIKFAAVCAVIMAAGEFKQMKKELANGRD